jgi:hypothetical protein
VHYSTSPYEVKHDETCRGLAHNTHAARAKQIYNPTVHLTHADVQTLTFLQWCRNHNFPINSNKIQYEVQPSRQYRLFHTFNITLSSLRDISILFRATKYIVKQSAIAVTTLVTVAPFSVSSNSTREIAGRQFIIFCRLGPPFSSPFHST